MRFLSLARMMIAGTVLATAGSARADAVLSSDGAVVMFGGAGPGKLDYTHAKPMPARKAAKAPPSQKDLINDASKPAYPGTPKVFPGAPGSGATQPTTLPQAQTQPSGDGGVSSQAYGSSDRVYTTSRAQAVSAYPERAAGKLFFNKGGETFVCSASLVQRGIVVVAAHCVANFGQSQYYSNWQFVPAYSSGNAPYGKWDAVRGLVLAKYYNGTDSCTQAGVICQDDVALLVLRAQSGQFAGDMTGYLGYAINGYSFNSEKQAQITQLGYPVALDSGELMERTDSQGATSTSQSNNTIIGTLQTGGASGGPWIVNFGTKPRLATGTGLGKDSVSNVVVGVTSWGPDDTSASGPKYQGASPFTSANIESLLTTACKAYPANCSGN